MDNVYLIFLLLAAICFFVEAFHLVASRLNLVALGLFFMVLVPLVGNLRAR